MASGPAAEDIPACDVFCTVGNSWVVSRNSNVSHGEKSGMQDIKRDREREREKD